MFNGEDNIRVRTSLPLRKVMDKVEQHLDELGHVSSEGDGEFRIHGTRFNNFAVEIKFDGWVEERGEEYEIRVRYSLNPTTGGIVMTVVLGLVLLPLILIPFFMVMNTQSEVKRKLTQALEDLQDALDARE